MKIVAFFAIFIACAVPAMAESNIGTFTAREFRDYCRNDNVPACRDVMSGVWVGLLRGAVYTGDEKVMAELLGCVPDDMGAEEVAVRAMQYFRDTTDNQLLDGNLGFALSDALLALFPCS